jgi:WhiB family redox-sensing transcriptional regulator
MARLYQGRAAAVGHPFDAVPGLPCRDEPNRWFPEQGNGGQGAQKTCRGRCPIVDACLTFALSTGQNHGVWGGMAADGRHNLTDAERARLVEAGRLQLRLIEDGEIGETLALR